MTEHPTAPHAPENSETLPAANPSAEALALLARRRSTPIAMLGGPGPDAGAVKEILRLAARVPDHRRVGPWRFIVIDGDVHGAALGERLDGVRAAELGADYTDDDKAAVLAMFTRAPICIGVVSSPDPAHKTPVWEQEMSAGAACQNLLLAANAMGWAGVWMSDWCAYSNGAREVFGVKPGEKIAGFIYLGTAKQDPPERPRPDLEARVSYWTGA